MTIKKISEFTQATSISDDDLILIEQEGGGKNVSIGTLGDKVIDSFHINGLSNSQLYSNSYLLVEDNGVKKKISFSDLKESIAPSITSYDYDIGDNARDIYYLLQWLITGTNNSNMINCYIRLRRTGISTDSYYIAPCSNIWFDENGEFIYLEMYTYLYANGPYRASLRFRSSTALSLESCDIDSGWEVLGIKVQIISF